MANVVEGEHAFARVDFTGSSDEDLGADTGSSDDDGSGSGSSNGGQMQPAGNATSVHHAALLQTRPATVQQRPASSSSALASPAPEREEEEETDQDADESIVPRKTAEMLQQLRGLRAVFPNRGDRQAAMEHLLRVSLPRLAAAAKGMFQMHRSAAAAGDEDAEDAGDVIEHPTWSDCVGMSVLAVSARLGSSIKRPARIVDVTEPKVSWCSGAFQTLARRCCLVRPCLPCGILLLRRCPNHKQPNFKFCSCRCRRRRR
jgi:hypothetical protein